MKGLSQDFQLFFFHEEPLQIRQLQNDHSVYKIRVCPWLRLNVTTTRLWFEPYMLSTNVWCSHAKWESSHVVCVIFSFVLWSTQKFLRYINHGTILLQGECLIVSLMPLVSYYFQYLYVFGCKSVVEKSIILFISYTLLCH